MRIFRRNSLWVIAALLAASIWPIARASAWDDSNTAPTKTLTGNTELFTSIDTAFDSFGNLYVLNFDPSVKSVNVYAAGHLNGHAAPIKHIDLDLPGLSLSIAIDSTDNVYVATYPIGGVAVYDDISTWAADGSTQPIKGLDVSAPLAIALDTADNLYVVDSEKVRVFDDISTWNQNGITQPSKSLVGNNTGLDHPASVELDDFDNMYVSNGGNNSITFYGVGWSDGNTAPSKTLVGSNTELDVPGSIAFDASGKMFVVNGCVICGLTAIGSPKVLAFDAGWTTSNAGNIAPIKTLTGDRAAIMHSSKIDFSDSGVMFATIENRGVGQFAADWVSGNTAPSGLLASISPSGIAFDQQGRMYVANQPQDSVTVYGANWAEGQAEPIKILYGANTGLASPLDISFDDVGNMYVANSSGYNGADVPDSVTVYGPDWLGGDTAPIRTLTGNNTALDNPVSVIFDSHNNMYVLNYSNNSVTMYGAGWANGDTAPTKTLVGANTGLDLPIDFVLDAFDNLYVVNDIGDTINVFAANWTDGDNAPIATLHGSATGLGTPESVAIGSNGKIYVTNAQGDSVTVYGEFNTWATDGNTAPLKTLSGADTGLDGPWGIAFDADGNMYVGNRESVTMYAGEVPPPPAITTPPVQEVTVLPATL